MYRLLGKMAETAVCDRSSDKILNFSSTCAQMRDAVDLKMGCCLDTAIIRRIILPLRGDRAFVGRLKEILAAR